MGIAMHLYLILLSLLLSLETQAAQSIFKSFSKTIKNILHIPEDPSLPSAWDFNDLSFSGITTFARLPHVKCLVHPEESFDIAILGCPFDTATSHRPGARFGPRAIRAASTRQSPIQGFGPMMRLNPYRNWAKMIDCGDIPVITYDNALALVQMQAGYETLLSRKVNTPSTSIPDTKTGRVHPRIMTLGGDHSIALPTLRALSKIYGPISVVHFDSHLDTYFPTLVLVTLVGHLRSGSLSGRAHSPNSLMGQCFGISLKFMATDWRMAAREGLIANGTSIHAGLRTKLMGNTFKDYDHDEEVGFVYIETDEIDTVGVEGIIDKIIEVVGTKNPVYLSVDIDVIDPGLCPGTGTPESGGWTTREFRQIIRGLHPLRIVAGDLVEVSPAYDVADTTALAASDVIFEMLSIMVKNPGFEGPKVDIAPPRRSKGHTERRSVTDEL